MEDIIQDFKFEVEVLRYVLELSLNKPKNLLKNPTEFTKLLKYTFNKGIDLSKNDNEKNIISFIQGLILFYFNSSWGIGKGLIRKCIIDKTGKKLKIILIGHRKIEFKIGEYDKGTEELFSLAKKVLWKKNTLTNELFNLSDINEIKKIFIGKHDDLKQTQKQLLKISQNPNDIIRIMNNLGKNVLPVFIFFSCLPEGKMEELFRHISNHLPSSYSENLPDGRKVIVSEYFLQKSKTISEYFDKIRFLLYLYSLNKHKIIEEIVKIKTRDFIMNLFDKDITSKNIVVKTILDTVESQFNPRIQLMGMFIRII